MKTSATLKFLYLSFILFPLSFFLLSCGDSGTGSNNGSTSISGRVMLEGQSDHSGVTVSLYAPMELDTALVRINQQYPNIGVQISQETEFDHREHTAVASATTAADGSWNINNVPQGAYNVVAEHDLWGWQYIHDMNDSNTGNINLNKQEFTGIYLNQAINFQDTFIEINDNTTFDRNSQLTISGVNFLVFTDDNLSLTIRGAVNIADNSKLYIFTKANNENCKVIFDTINNLQVRNLLVLNTLEISIIGGNFSVRNSIFFNSEDIALKISRADGAVDNCLFKNSRTGTNFNIATDSGCRQSIFYNNGHDVEIFGATNFLLSNNMFSNSNLNTELKTSDGLVHHNSFEFSDTNVVTLGESDLRVHTNDFRTNNINIDLRQFSHAQPSIRLTANWNNFRNTNGFHIKLGQDTARETVHAENNYWGTTSEAFITSKILDRDDDGRLERVIFMPFQSTTIDSSGINLN